MFDMVKVFSATKARERGQLGDVITDWLIKHSDMVVVDQKVLQSSDHEFHCLSIILFLKKEC